VNPICRVPWHRPTPIGDVDVGEIRPMDYIVFKLETDPLISSKLYRYRCMDCYAACGDLRHSFVTEFDSPDYMKDGPSEDQEEEIRDHTRQHQIMWSWARSVDK
jgi:hypothetical protein